MRPAPGGGAACARGMAQLWPCSRASDPQSPTPSRRLALLEGADRQCAAWRERAEAAEPRVAELEAALAAEKARGEELLDSTWPLAAKIKALEAQLAAGGGNSAAG